jgi:hypothetical protein
MPFMPAVRLNQRSGAPTRSGIRFSAKGSPVRFLLFLFSPVLQFNLLALSTSAVRTRAMSLVLGLSFYPLECDASQQHNDIHHLNKPSARLFSVFFCS